MAVIEHELIEQARDLRLKTLLTYLATDRENTQLRADAAEQALAAREPEIANKILGEGSSDLSKRELNLAGLAHMQCGAFAEAAKNFEALLAEGIEDPAIKFNLAWSLSMSKDFAAALELLTDEVTTTIAQAAMLEIQLLHNQGEFELAVQKAHRHLETHSDHPGLAAAISVLAMDVEDLELAHACAERAGTHPDALATLGALALSEQRVEAAIDHFDRALQINQYVPRAWIGLGLAKLLSKDPKNAASDIDHGAEQFGDHIGSWIAAGWAYLIAGDFAESRDRFERALSIDENFAESHGSLAVIDAIEKQTDAAQRGIIVALKLDRGCFSARLAQSLLTAGKGDPQSAQKMFEKILEGPVNERGDTVAAALARLSLR